MEFHSLVFMESDRRRQKVWNLFTVELRQSKQKHLRLPLKCPSTNISSFFWEFLPAGLRSNNWSTSRLISLMVRPLAAPGHQQRVSHRGHHHSVLSQTGRLPPTTVGGGRGRDTYLWRHAPPLTDADLHENLKSICVEQRDA